MKKLIAVLVTAVLLAACDITGILPGSQLEVDGPAITSSSLESGESARFEVFVGSSGVRIDAIDLDNGVAGSVLLRVYDGNNVLYAQTMSHRYFIAPKPEIIAENVADQGIAVSPVYSINIPPGAGKFYVEVTNMAANPTRIEVKAVSREPLPYSDDVFSPTPADFAATTSGALIYLGQTDIWKYTGSGPATLELDGGETVHATARIVGNGLIKANLEPGEYYDGLENGDLVYVQAAGNGATAGFCANLSGCNDGIDSGEYQLLVTTP
ncbi:hypothetical protein [Oceanithermus sp.]